MPHAECSTVKFYDYNFIFTLLKANQREYHEKRTTSNPQRPDNDMHDDPKKDDRSKNW